MLFVSLKDGNILTCKLINVKSKRYLGGVTKIYHELGLIKESGSTESKLSKWKIENNEIYVVIE